MTKFAAPFTVAVAVSLSLSGCSGELGSFFTLGGQTQAQVEPTGDPKTTLSPADVQYLRSIWAHGNQAIELGKMAKRLTQTHKIRAIAKSIGDARDAEVATIKAILVAAGEPANPNHHDMPGFATNSQMSELAHNKDAKFDAMFLTMMVTHHDGAISMSKDILAKTKNTKVTEVANAIIAAETDELDQLNRLLGP